MVLVKNKTINCAHVILDLSWWKIQYPKKSLCCFRGPKKSQRLSQTQKNPFWPKCQTQKNPSDPPIIKICEWGPWDLSLQSRNLFSKSCFTSFLNLQSDFQKIPFDQPLSCSLTVYFHSQGLAHKQCLWKQLTQTVKTSVVCAKK